MSPDRILYSFINKVARAISVKSGYHTRASHLGFDLVEHVNQVLMEVAQVLEKAQPDLPLKSSTMMLKYLYPPPRVGVVNGPHVSLCSR